MARGELGSTSKLILMILNVLKQYSSENHRLTQEKIADYIEKDYGIRPERKAVGRNLSYLEEMGYDVDKAHNGYCIFPEFEDAELQLLIDSVMFSRFTTEDQSRRLIDKLINQGSADFKHTAARSVCQLPRLSHGSNTATMNNIHTLSDAIARGKQVTFTYKEYGTDKQLHPCREKPYLVNPYYLASRNGWYYLIGNYDKYDNISHYRIDRMGDVNVVEDSIVKPKKDVKPVGFDLPKHMAEHVYMFAGNTKTFIVKTDKSMMNDFVDWFGKDFEVMDSPDSKGNIVYVRLKCDEDAMVYWAIQYGQYVEVIEPESVRIRIRDIINGMHEKYSR